MTTWHVAVALQRLIESGRLRARMTSDLALVLERPPTAEPWVDKHALAEHLSCSRRWLAERLAEGLPHAVIAGRVKFRVVAAERWLVQHGHIEHRRVDVRGMISANQTNGGGTALTARPPTKGDLTSNGT
jgi:hypothetical protein